VTQGLGEPGDGGAEAADAERFLLGGVPRYTRQQAAERAGVSLQRAARLWRSLGFATPGDTELVFADADVDALRTITTLHDTGVASPVVELALARAIGQTMSRLTEWQVELLRELTDTGESTDSGESHGAGAVSGLASAAALVPTVERLQLYVWRRHLLAATERLLSSATQAGERASMAVGFADIVGFTSLSRGLTEVRLAEFLDEFEASASEVVTERHGRVIKTVGDEIMFVADTAGAAAAIGLDLADRLSALDSRPDLRTGLAYGPVLRRLGDVYGPVVNLASRLTALARPGTVLVDRELATALERETCYQVKKLRRVSVRGYSHLQPWLLRRA
jgi:adenylate cyclase